MSFNALSIRNSVDNEPYCFYRHRGYYDSYNSYENNLNLTNQKKYAHFLEEYEVYKLAKKNQ